MGTLDWIVLFGTLLGIVGYGVYKTRGSQNIESYLLGDKSMRWWTIGLSIMATQASAITFLSTPGQAFEDGLRFVQFYFGLPLAMVVLSITAIPIFYRLKVYTAYEYLEGRFDLKTRTLAAFLFLIQRGLAAGITIYAPSIILSSVLGMDLRITNIIIGGLVIIYTVSGGTKAVSQTQKHQMIIILAGMIIAFVFLLRLLPESVGFGDAMQVAGKMGKLNAVNFKFDLSDRYNVWSGLLGGFFLAMAYFGTDQSQVQRYLSGQSIKQSRLGLLFNGMIKVPMQFGILLVGVMVFVFYQFYEPPIFFNQEEKDKVAQNEIYGPDLARLEDRHHIIFDAKREEISIFLDALDADQTQQIAASSKRLDALDAEMTGVKKDVKALMKKNDPDAETKDADYVFITFVKKYLPEGIVGLLFAVIFSAAMSSTSGELNALASTTTVDLYKRSIKPKASDRHYLESSKWFTVAWGLLAILFATFASLFDNLIEAVNILGSLFYGTVLGIFVAAFYIKYLKGSAVFYAALIAETIVLLLYIYSNIGYLWFNVIGCGLVILFALLIQISRNTAKYTG